MPRVNARALKVTVVLNAEEVVVIPDIGGPRTMLHIQVADFGTVSADIASKSMRKAQATISEHGTDAVAVLIQGKLVSGGRIAECGLVAQVKVPRPVVAEVAA